MKVVDKEGLGYEWMKVIRSECVVLIRQTMAVIHGTMRVWEVSCDYPLLDKR